MDLSLKETNKIIGDNFKKFRKSRKLTQEEVAEKSDVTPEYLSKFENGKYNASIYNIILMCKSVNITVTELLNDFFRNPNNTITENLIDEIRTLNTNDQKILLDIVKRFKESGQDNK